jgi:Reverse transcriptase (RNA-dependent DNA polymerase)
LVALGYSQVPGVDFSENYAPVVNNITMRMMLVLKLTNEWSSKTIDVETAFLYGNLMEEIYMTIPNGLEEYLNQQLSDNCVKLNKSIYGLVQAARAWWKQFTNSLQKIGFNKCPSDNCLMMRINKFGTTILCIYVDNVCVFGNQEAVETAIKQIESIYNIKRVGTLTEFIGVNIKTKDDDLFLGQEDTLRRLENKFQEDISKMKQYETPAGANDNIN